MSNRFRIALCTRYRPLTLTILISAAWVAWFLALGVVSSAVREHQERVLDVRLAKIKIGTTRAEVIAILGKPDFTERIKSNKYSTAGAYYLDTNIQGVNKQEDLERAAKENTELVEFKYHERLFLGRESRFSVCFDQTGQRTVLVPGEVSEWVSMESTAPLVILTSFGFMAVIAYLGFRFWCARQMRFARGAAASQPRPDDGRTP